MQPMPLGGPLNRDSPRFATWKRKGRATAISKSSKLSKRAPFPGRGYLVRRAEFPRLAATTWKDTRRKLRFLRECRLLTDQSKRAKLRGNNWTTARIG